jgi:hypothetical protein
VRGERKNTNAPSDAWGSRFAALGKSEIFVLRPRPEARAGPNSSVSSLGSSIWDPQARFFLLIGDLCDAPFALDGDDEAAPVLRVRVLGEPVLDAVDDLVELAVCERPDEDHAGMLATRF